MTRPSWNSNPSDYEKLAIWLYADQKKALIKYTADRGTNLTTAIRRIIDRLLSGEIDLGFKAERTWHK